MAIKMETKLMPANTSKLLLTTAPSEVKALGLKEGGQVVWEIVPACKKFYVNMSFVSMNTLIFGELGGQRNELNSTRTLPELYQNSTRGGRERPSLQTRSGNGHRNS